VGAALHLRLLRTDQYVYYLRIRPIGARPCICYITLIYPCGDPRWVSADCSLFGRQITITLIARRSRYFAGTRYRKRGINDKVWWPQLLPLHVHSVTT